MKQKKICQWQPFVLWMVFSFLILPVTAQSLQTAELLTREDMSFLTGMTRDVVEASRILPGQKVSADFGGNMTGGTLIRPGGRDCYPAFWIRDYAMSLETGFITREEQSHMLLLTASTQCSQAFITKAGSMVPAGSVADHIRIDDSKPVFFPGTYSYLGQGGEKFGYFPPYCDQYFFIHMAWNYVRAFSGNEILTREIDGISLIDRLEMAYRVPPVQQEGVMVFTTEHFRGIDFGFRDVITITGNLCMASILKYRASLEMAGLSELLGRKGKAREYQRIASRLKEGIPAFFADGRGMLRASDGTGSQADVWATALAAEFGILTGESLEKCSRFLADAYKKGWLANNGNIRHVLICDDFNSRTAWEKSLANKNDYQNGAWWGTPVGWVCRAIAVTDKACAAALAADYIRDLREGDFRKGPTFGAPWECYNTGKPQNAVYMTTVTAPCISFRQKP